MWANDGDECRERVGRRKEVKGGGMGVLQGHRVEGRGVLQGHRDEGRGVLQGHRVEGRGSSKGIEMRVGGPPRA